MDRTAVWTAAKFALRDLAREQGVDGIERLAKKTIMWWSRRVEENKE